MQTFSRFARILSAQRQPKPKQSLGNVNQLQGEILEMNTPKPERELPREYAPKAKHSIQQAQRKAAFNPIKIQEQVPPNPKSLLKKNHKLEEIIDELLSEEFSDILKANSWEITHTNLVDKERVLRVFWFPIVEEMDMGDIKNLQVLLDCHAKMFNLAIKRVLLPYNKWTAPSSYIPRVEFKFDHEWLQTSRLNKTLDQIELDLRMSKSDEGME